jgi:hypothetical protein
LIAALFLPTIACNKTTASSIVGTWKQQGGGDSVTFSSDGTYKATLVYGITPMPGQFSGTYFVDGQTVSLTDNAQPSVPMTWDVKIDGNQMTVTYKAGYAKENGSMARYVRQ